MDLQDFKYGMCNVTGFRLVQESNNEYQQLVEAMASEPYNYQIGREAGLRASV